jgi:hypothetical protein
MLTGYKVEMTRKTTSYKKRVKVGGVVGNNQGGDSFPVSSKSSRSRLLSRNTYTPVPED